MSRVGFLMFALTLLPAATSGQAERVRIVERTLTIHLDPQHSFPLTIHRYTGSMIPHLPMLLALALAAALLIAAAALILHGLRVRQRGLITAGGLLALASPLPLTLFAAWLPSGLHGGLVGLELLGMTVSGLLLLRGEFRQRAAASG